MRPLFFENLDNKDKTIHKRLEKIGRLSEKVHVAGLPDCHFGEQETPVSVVTYADGFIIPQLTSNVINCGIGLVRFNISPTEVADRQEMLLKRLHQELHAGGCYLGKEMRESIFRGGAPAFAELSGKDPAMLNHFDEGGVSGLHKLQRMDLGVDRIVPRRLFNEKRLFHMPGCGFSGNHFIEWQEFRHLNQKGCGPPLNWMRTVRIVCIILILRSPTN